MRSDSGRPLSAPAERTSRRWPAAGWWLIYLALALAIMCVAGPRTSLNPRSLLPDQVRGTAARPYVKRALVGLIVRGADALVPAATHSALDSTVARTPFLRDRLRWEPEHATWFALVFAIHLVSLTLFAAAFARLLIAALGAGAASAAWGGALGLALVPIHFGYQNFVYDFPGLALFTLGLVFLQERRWRAFYLLWPLGLLNKETFVLIAPVFAITQWRSLRRRSLAAHLAAQAVSFVAIWAALAWAFRANAGTALEWHLFRNLSLHPPARQLVHDALYVGFWVFAFARWRKQRTLAAATLAVGGTLFATTLFFGFLGEYRDFYEAWPLVATMAANTTMGGMERRPSPAS